MARSDQGQMKSNTSDQQAGANRGAGSNIRQEDQGRTSGSSNAQRGEGGNLGSAGQNKPGARSSDR
jgi:hypothetical protein